MAAETQISGTLLGALAKKYEAKYSGKSVAQSWFFPSDDVPVEDKGREWCLAWQQALWSLFVRGGAYNTATDYEKLQLLRLYGAGRQPNGVYMNLLLGDDEVGNPARKGWLSTNWDIFSPAPKLHREIRGRFETQEYDYVATAVDPSSTAEKEEKAWDVWYNSQYGKKEQEIMDTLGVEAEQGTQYIAQSLEELDLFKDMGGFKLKIESEAETVLDMTDYLSDIKTIKQKVIDDLVDWNKAAYRDYYDPITGLVKYEYMDWLNLILDFSNETDFKGGRFWSYVKLETINHVRVRAPELTEADLIKMASINVGLWGNSDANVWGSYQNAGYKTAKGVRVYDQFRIPVLVSEWISTDTEYKVAKINKAGLKTYYKKSHGEVSELSDKNRANLSMSRVNTVYQSTWIIGSDYVYDYGKSLNSARPNPKEPRLSIHAVAIPGKSIIETCVPIFDQIELGWLRRQSAIATTAPPGYDYNLSEMEEVSVGGKKWDIFEQIKLQMQTGNSIRRSTGLSNDKSSFNGKSINRNEGGFGTYMTDIMADLGFNFRMIAELTGIDIIGASIAQTASQTATEVKYAAATTSDALQPLFTSWVQMKEDSAVTALFKIQRAIKYNPESREAYEGILGKSGTKILELGANTTLAQMGIKLEIRPTAEMKAAAIQAATEALKPGKNGENITLPDWWYFVNMIERGRAKHAMAILKYRLDKGKEDAIKLQRENMQLNGQNMVQAQQAKTEGSMMEINAEIEGKMKLQAQAALLDMKIDDNDAKNTVLIEEKKALIEKILKIGRGAPKESEVAA